MLVGRDIGFSYPVLFFSLIGPLFFFFLRRRWQRYVARKEEINRLLILAAEEAARVELEFTADYYTSSVPSFIPPPQQQPQPPTPTPPPQQYICAVCSAPTKTRCARCKAVRYCSSKCQIVHWRQRHKDECHTFTIHDDTDNGFEDAEKESKHLEYENGINNIGTEDDSHTKSDGHFPEDLSSHLDLSSEDSSLNDESEVDCIAPGEGIDSHFESLSEHDSKSNVLDNAKSSCVADVEKVKLSLSERTYVNDTVNHLNSPPNSIKHKSRVINQNSQNISSKSVGSFKSDFCKSPLSDPSVPSTDFWDGTIKAGRARLDAQGDSAQSKSSRDSGIDADEESVLNRSHGDGNCGIDDIDAHENSAQYRSSRDDNCSINDSIPPPSSSFNLHKSRASNIRKDDSNTSTPGISMTTKIRGRTILPEATQGNSSNTNNLQSSTSLRTSKTGSVGSFTEGKNQVLSPLVSESGGSKNTLARDAPLLSSIRTSSVQDAKPMQSDGSSSVPASSHFTDHSPNVNNGLRASVLKVVEQPPKSSRHYLAGRYDNKALFPYDQFVKLYNWKKVELQPCGLMNCGNSCYANVVLQCLAFTPPLTAYFLQGIHSKACVNKEWCFICEFESLIMKAKGGISPVSPIGILSQIQNIGSHMGNGKQEDAHEFLRYAIEKMQSVFLKENGANTSGCLEETTLIGLTFGGYLRSKIKCMKCGVKSERHERMMDLTVEIEGNIGTLEEALGRFTATEVLDGENKYHCSRCKSYEKARKRLTVYEAPNILTITLKRFQSGKYGKLNKSIKFPETLNLAPCMSRTSDKSPVYMLYGVVVHLDTMNATFSGHYVCYIKNVQNKWFKIDDSNVKTVDRESVLTKGAYMLLYARCSPRAPRLVRNPCIPHEIRNLKCPSKHVLNKQGRKSRILYPVHGSSQPMLSSIHDEDSSSDNASSLFSEECSCSTESSNVDSTVSDDIFEQFLTDVGCHVNNLWKHSSDSDSSSSSSSSSPSPLYARYPYHDASPISNPESGKSSRELGSSCREPDSERIGRVNDGVPLRRSIRERKNG
ncbi:ubiquitin carboxyl-terminal hydrolase 17-like [Impatiens glandulifera]|uniref:ubiquitin carboxyl-terminal hydrolase 17-like n=1 Tax=Impatiens glandulifera TaxID=253017 RepID=UPI001FB0FD6F|nr:ubiquitin carboxyl-terminal hydrolase 17-like [Impatiens glandulifera]